MRVCTKETPWDHQPGRGMVRHDDAREVGDQQDGYPSGDIVTMECPNCKHRWTVELPQ